jgi:hypothetical protein
MSYKDVSIVLKVSYLPRRYKIAVSKHISLAHFKIHSVTLHTCDQIRYIVLIIRCVITWQPLTS